MPKMLFHLPLHRYRSLAILLLLATLSSGLSGLTKRPEIDSNSAICSNRPAWSGPVSISQENPSQSPIVVNNQPAIEARPESTFAPVQLTSAAASEKEQEPRTAQRPPFSARAPPLR
ncbi:MAG: hypothetical protein CVV45_03840 [Spirochaetae bacterium HGW-Spirochaetae-10]|nr:MAG: hypothetical protein CVV45_03840 [Spirochaetae bacterium HGW-Spirochaetae-10]